MQDGTMISAAPIMALQWLMVNRESLRARWLSSTS